jgi:hypothetical protein
VSAPDEGFSPLPPGPTLFYEMTGSHADEIVSDFFESDDWAEELLEDDESESGPELAPPPEAA